MTEKIESKELTPADKLAARTGECVSLACSFDCEAFAHAKYRDGFDTCVCGHTRWSHARKSA